MPPITLRPTTALNLELQGSTGSFRVGAAGADKTSLEVKYFLTHVSLDYETGASAQVLSHLAPVRELFEIEQLEFDEIMQRDIDDARVTSQLVPYLLDAKSRDLVKLFPPIIVVVLPTKPNSNSPADLYPAIIREEVSGNEHKELHTRSGSIGQEIFEFIQPMIDGKAINHDLNRLKLNTHRTRLVIVDGQHRAMALLALYRNLLQDWSDSRRAPYKDFYEEWTPNYIRKFKLNEISLPVMMCTFPDLDENYQGDFDLKKAARSIFLTLNKTARKVSASRNRLLDDNDLIAVFLRNTLSAIKQRETTSPNSLRIFNIELDQSQDRTKIESAIAFTGVSHIYYLIEHLLLNQKEEINGVRARAGKYYKRADLESYGAFKRLDGRNILGSDIAGATNRNYFTRETGIKLTAKYKEVFGNYIEKFFVNFAPFEAHCRASLWLEQHLLNQENRKLRPIVFEGQGLSRVFNEHRELLKEKFKNREFGSEATKIAEIIQSLNVTANLITNSIDLFKAKRAEYFTDGVSDKAKVRSANDIHPKLLSFISGLYDNLFSSVAFQVAVIGTFFGEIERAQSKFEEAGLGSLDISKEFEAFLECLHAFFIPKSSKHLRRIIEVFVGGVDGEIADFKIVHNPNTYREVVYPGEMQPDQWPKYRFMILELWQPTNTDLANVISGERQKARIQVFSNLTDRKKGDYLRNNAKREEDLEREEWEGFHEQAHDSLTVLLRNLLGAREGILPKRELIEAAHREQEANLESSDRDDNEMWGDTEEVNVEIR